VDHKVEFRKRRFCVKVAQLLPGKYFIWFPMNNQ
jgi:hypothetical protein